MATCLMPVFYEGSEEHYEKGQRVLESLGKAKTSWKLSQESFGELMSGGQLAVLAGLNWHSTERGWLTCGLLPGYKGELRKKRMVSLFGAVVLSELLVFLELASLL